jgi:uncharacterized RDD family membrane protein YckC
MIRQLPRADFVPSDPASIFQYRTFWRRAFAALVDGGLMILVGCGLMYLASLLRRPLYYPLYLGVATVVDLWYTASLTYRYGGTLGKLALGIRVVDFKGLYAITFGQSLFREVPNVLLSVGSVLIASLLLANGGAVALSQYLAGKPRTIYSEIRNYLSYAFLVLELGTCLFSEKRRAVHDFLARTVAIRSGKARLWLAPIALVTVIPLLMLDVAVFNVFRNSMQTQ